MQSINLFDFYMAPGVWKTFLSAFKKSLKIAKRTLLKNSEVLDNFIESITWENRQELPRYNNKDSLQQTLDDFMKRNDDDLISTKMLRKVFDFAFEQANEDTQEETWQAMEAFVFNMNTLASRAGAQVPFSSVNLGCDTSEEGRLVTKNLINAIYRGLGKHETSIFPQLGKVINLVNLEI